MLKLEVRRLPCDQVPAVSATRDGNGLWHVDGKTISEPLFVREYDPLERWTPTRFGPVETVRVQRRDLRPAWAIALRDDAGVWAVAGERLSEEAFLARWEPLRDFEPFVPKSTRLERRLRELAAAWLTRVIDFAVALRSRLAPPSVVRRPAREEYVEEPSTPAPVAGEVIE